MNYQKITPVSIADGIGCRVVLWVSGCQHHCYNCHNPGTHELSSGYLFDESAKKELFDRLNPDYIDGITFSGGDPLHPANRETVTALTKEIKQRFPNKSIWLYTGYTHEEVSDLEIMNYLDVLVDGKYEDDKRCVGQFYGSTNQRLIYLKQYGGVLN